MGICRDSSPFLPVTMQNRFAGRFFAMAGVISTKAQIPLLLSILPANRHAAAT
jgi:hypothetical protein